MDELKPCPFCGGLVDYDSMQFSKKGITLHAKCIQCKTYFRVLKHVYNTRPIEDELRAEIERLERDNKGYLELLGHSGERR